jgi:hypothetical protein
MKTCTLNWAMTGTRKVSFLWRISLLIGCLELMLTSNCDQLSLSIALTVDQNCYQDISADPHLWITDIFAPEYWILYSNINKKPMQRRVRNHTTDSYLTITYWNSHLASGTVKQQENHMYLLTRIMRYMWKLIDCIRNMPVSCGSQTPLWFLWKWTAT